MSKTDRRVQRTRELLQKALIELIRERGYEVITIQNIVDRANIGRTTFYLHYNSKDELFMMHEGMDGRHNFAVHLKTNDPGNSDFVVNVLFNWIP